ncbi:MAG TPA: PIN domain-containing protein [Dehalococcoidia bacterium]|nr:PIN domain-containing protein [Dehalococcoidia bacterium]
MPVDETTPVFFDASCLAAAAGSPAGGSGYLLTLCQRTFLLGFVSPGVLAEAERNVVAKLPRAQSAYQRLLATTPLASVSIDPPAAAPFAELVGQKDAHVVAAALAAGAAYLITHDKPLVQRVSSAQLPIVALSPGTFIQTVLPSHPGLQHYPRIADPSIPTGGLKRNFLSVAQPCSGMAWTCRSLKTQGVERLLDGVSATGDAQLLAFRHPLSVLLVCPERQGAYQACFVVMPAPRIPVTTPCVSHGDAPTGRRALGSGSPG